MLVQLSVVDDVFEIGGRGSVVVVPGIPAEGDWRIKAGDPITLERPDGSKLETTIKGLESLRPLASPYTALLIGNGLAKSDVPIGTTLWVAQGN